MRGRTGGLGQAGVALVCLALVLAAPRGLAQSAPGGTLPSSLSDRDFWQFIENTSEADGFFQSDNLVGNERQLQSVVPALRTLARGGVYLGVAPDQNFTYILAVEPRIAFVIDIRRGNLLEHLMYKAIFELSETRADFLSRLFSRPRPERLGRDASVKDLFDAYWPIEPKRRAYEDNIAAIERQLTVVHGFPLSSADLDTLRTIYQAFVRFGPALTYTSTSGGGMGRTMPTYAEMQQATDDDGRPRGYLATEEAYGAIRSFERKNLLVPVVGDFAGPKTLRAVGAYVAAHGAVVTAFYVSNVEQYLFRNAVAPAFYANVATLPIEDGSVFIRSAFNRNVIDPIRPLLTDVASGHIRDYTDVTRRGAVQEP
jgi:hypothetical protein